MNTSPDCCSPLCAALIDKTLTLPLPTACLCKSAICLEFLFPLRPAVRVQALMAQKLCVFKNRRLNCTLKSIAFCFKGRFSPFVISAETFCGCTCCFTHENIGLLSNLNVAIKFANPPDVMSYDLTCLDHDDGGATRRGGGGEGQI